MFKIISAPYLYSSSNKELLSNSFKSLQVRKDVGFFRIAEREDIWKDCQELAQEKKKLFKNLLVVGVGGSSLGARALDELKKSGTLFFLDNVDPFAIEETLQQIRLEETCFCFISKSGSTLETLGTLEVLQALLKSKGLDLAQQSVVITEPRSNSLRDWAESNRVSLLAMPLDVGGRFSVLTAVGLFPAAWMGYRLEDLRKGALQALNSQDLIQNLAFQYLESFKQGKSISVFWFYSSQFRFFGSWLQQLWAESLAKLKNRNGEKAPLVSTPFVAIGSTDQHSLLQQMMEGAQDKFIAVFKFASMTRAHQYQIREPHFEETKVLAGKCLGDLICKQAEATSEALSAAGNPVMLIEVSELEDDAIGFQLMLWMMVVGVLGEALDINAFDQPGVELGKVLTREKLL